jgi:TonB family protein
MRSKFICTLALLPVLAHAQVNGPQAGTSSATAASVTLQAKITEPAAFFHAATTPAAATPAPAAPMHDEIAFTLDSDPVDTAALNSGSIQTHFGSSEPEATAPRLVHVVGRTLPVFRLMNEENNAYVVVHAKVDYKGVPQNITIAHSAGAAIDQQTIAAVSQYRFVPATVDHAPVQSDVTVRVMLKN